jgi:hypothetical protein
MAQPGVTRGPDRRYTADWINHWLAQVPELGELLDVTADIQGGDWIDTARTGRYPIVLDDHGVDERGHRINRIDVLGLLNSLFRTSDVMLVPSRDGAGRIVQVAVRTPDWVIPPRPTPPPTPAPTPPPTVTAAASFLRRDDDTQGTWKGKYGAAGFRVAQDTGTGNPTLPPGVTIDVAGGADATWAPATDDMRAPQRTDRDARFAACWYTFEALDVAVRQGQNTRQVALYLLDWDRAGRSQLIDVLDTGTGTVLDTYKLVALTNGVYLVWTIRGDVTFRVTSAIPGFNAVLSGIFLDAAP